MSRPTGTTRATQLWFTAPHQVEVREVTLPDPGPGQALVKVSYSAVSAGTELLVYRGQLPQSMPLESTLESLQQSTEFPLQFGYACVGEVQRVGDGVDSAWQGRQVFSFQPHASHYVAAVEDLKAVPEDLSAQEAVFLPNMETAINLAHDGRPLAGERVVVLGQGIVGLLLSAVLARYPLESLIAVEGRPERQELARRLGVQRVIAPQEAGDSTTLFGTAPAPAGGADLLYEVSGHPEALNLAVSLSGYCSRLVIGSWYGNKPVAMDLGGEAHRNRLQLITSQVSTLAPALTGRWDKQRRFDLAWQMLRQVDPQQLITHTVPLQEAGSLYRDLHEEKPGFVQALFHYPD